MLSPQFIKAVLLLVLAGALTGACRDQPGDNPVVGPDGARPAATYSPDPDINQDDSYYLAEVSQEGSTTVESETPITDPTTGAVSNQYTAHHEPETQRIEGGYDDYGRIIQVLDQTNPAGDPLTTAVNTTRRTRSVQDDVTRYDGYGQPVANELTPGESLEPLAMAGPSDEQITDGLILDAAAIDALAELSPTAVPLAAAAGPRASVRRPAPDEIQITNELDGEDFALFPGKGSDQVASRGQTVRTYRRRGQKYLLNQVEVTTTHRSEKARVHQRQVSRVRLLRYHENPQRDRARRDRRRGRPVPASMTPLAYEEICPMSMESTSDTCQSPPPDDPPPPTEDPCPQVASGVSVLFQHGIFSSGATWWRMDPWIRCSFQTNAHIRPSINWFNPIPTQREEVLPALPVYGETVLIGHSNGGLVTRSLAQWAQMHRPGSVRGVITLDSPNQGAMLAINAQVVEGIVFSMAGNAGLAFDLISWHPFWEDDVPHSPFLIRTNSFDESFKRVGNEWAGCGLERPDGSAKGAKRRVRPRRGAGISPRAPEPAHPQRRLARRHDPKRVCPG
ncbi:MAG: hypothetical protein KY464_18610 [Gemmatimonadetes bacterium]|nr:hypothetical protein [Gemmatimonadota bacterium]